jgi:arabinofuranan 3-O-arabinosyltransferase
LTSLETRPRRRAPTGGGDDDHHGADAAGWPTRRRTLLAHHLVLAALVYVPLLLTRPGWVAADTKTYLYLEPGRLLSRAASMWDPSIGLGTVTHQNIGYLWPMGPWYWVFDRLGAPDWLAQRLWLGTVMFAAGAGVLFLLRTLRWRGPAVLAAATLFMLSPYVLHYGARISVILLPWAGLPWLIALAERSLRRGGWRDPALFALVVATVGGVNATALVMAGLGPLLWLPFSVATNREISLRRALQTAGRMGVLTVACSLWWMAGLAVQGGYGIDILRYTETVETVARTSLASEVLRGLGYWFFYGGDLLGPWIEPGRSYTQELWLIALGFAVPLAAVAAGVSIRWRHRAYFVSLVVVGTAAAVGAFPYDDPSPVGGLFKDLATGSTVGLAMRSTPRAVPLVVLGLSVLIGAGIVALSRRAPRLGLPAAVVAIAVAVAGLPPLWTGDMIGENLERPEEIPGYWHEAAAWLDDRGSQTRVLTIPGTDFASYRWGNTVDPVLPGLMDRPSVARELIPYGSPPSADLLMALDRRMQEGVLDPAALAPMARLLAAGDVLLRSDLQFERYRTPRPRTLRADLTPVPPGLEAPVEFGPPVPNVVDRELPLIDEMTLTTPADVPHPAPVTVFPVPDANPIVRAAPAAGTVLLAGDGEGVVEAASAGLLDGPAPVLYDADLVAAGADAARREVLERGAAMVLTDSNRRRARRWSTVRENVGITEAAGEVPLETEIDQRLPLFPGAGDDTRTVVEHRGVRRVQASSYGNNISFTTEDRPALAFDGDPTTAWRTGAFGQVVGERLLVEALEPVTTDRVQLTQTLTGARNRWITAVEVHLDGELVHVEELTDQSRQQGGQEVVFGERTFTTLELVAAADNVDGREADGLSSAGFAEVDVAGIRVDEVVRLPPTLLAEAGGAAATNDLAVVLARGRSDPRELYRRDEEVAMTRSLELPASRTFTLSGQARVSARAADHVLDAAVGRPSLPTARSEHRLVDDIGVRASSAFDGDPSTAWRPIFGDQSGQWVELEAGEPMEVDRLDLVLVTDGQHSVPTRLRLEGDGAPVATVDVPPVEDLDEPGATTAVSVTVPAFRASTVRVVIDEVREVLGSDSFSEFPQTVPVGIAEVGLPASVSPLPDQLDTGCRDDLLSVDGAPVPLRVTGALGAGAGAGREGLAVEACEGDLVLPAGEHVIRAADGRATGIDLDRLVLRSADGGGAAAAPGGAPVVEVTGEGRTSFDLDLHDVDGPFWLVLGQSHNAGWEASVDGLGDLGPSRIVDGYANGWWVEPGDARELSVALRWTPQGMVWWALALSVLAALACLALVLFGRRHHALAPDPGGAGPWHPRPASPLLGPGRSPALVATVGATAGLALVAGAISRPWVGLVVGALAAVALLLRRGRALLTVGAVAAVGLAGAYVVVRQSQHGYAPDFGWPTFFWWAHALAWTAILLLLADVVVTWLRERAGDT